MPKRGSLPVARVQEASATLRPASFEAPCKRPYDPRRPCALAAQGQSLSAHLEKSSISVRTSRKKDENRINTPPGQGFEGHLQCRQNLAIYTSPVSQDRQFIRLPSAAQWFTKARSFRSAKALLQIWDSSKLHGCTPRPTNSSTMLHDAPRPDTLGQSSGKLGHSRRLSSGRLRRLRPWTPTLRPRPALQRPPDALGLCSWWTQEGNAQAVEEPGKASL